MPLNQQNETKWNQNIYRVGNICLIWFGLVWFYGISTIVGYLMPNPFYTYKQFYFKQFSLAQVHSLKVKTVLCQTIQCSQQS